MNRTHKLLLVPKRLRRRTAGAICGLSLLLLAGGPATSAHAIDCSSATALSAQGYPQRAVAFVDGINAGLPDGATGQCVEERASAIAAIQNAQRLALDARADLASGGTGGAQSKAVSAIGLDRENALASEILATVAAPKGWWARAAKGWEDFRSAVVEPAGAVALPAVVFFFALIVVARLLTSLWPSWPDASSAVGARGRLAGGVAVTALASGALVLLGSGGLPLPDQPARGVAFTAFGIVGAVGVWLTARGLATRLRVAVVARRDGDEDVESAGQVMAYLEQFGATPPQGIERPSGPDVQALATALADVEGGLAKTLKSAVAAVTGWTPWQVTVDHCGDEQIAVAISRNGRSHGAVIVGPDLLTVDGVDLKVDPRVFAASFVLTTLARAHSGFEGLCGTTDWVALGWQYVASTNRQTLTDNDKAISLLSAALGRDPGSWLTQVDLANRRWRFSDAAEDLTFYETWLRAALQKLPTYDPEAVWLEVNAGYAPLKLRMLLSLAATRINLHCSRRDDAPDPEELDRVTASIANLCLAIADAEETFSTRHIRYDSGWLDTFKARAAAMANMLTDEKLDEVLGNNKTVTRAVVRSWDRLPAGPRAHYSRACALASPKLVAGAGWNDQEAPRVAAELREAVTDPQVASWLHKDPQMAGFRKTDSYHEFRPSPRIDLLLLEPFTAHQSMLARIKADSAPALAGLDPAVLSSYAPLPAEDAVKLVGAAGVVESLRNDRWLAPLAVETAALLLEREQASRPVLVALDEEGREDLSAHLADGTVRFVAAQPPATLRGEFRTWLDAAYPHP